MNAEIASLNSGAGEIWLIASKRLSSFSAKPCLIERNARSSKLGRFFEIRIEAAAARLGSSPIRIDEMIYSRE